MYRSRLVQSIVAVILMGIVAGGMTAKPARADEATLPFNASASGTMSWPGGPSFSLAGTFKANHLGSNLTYGASGLFTGPSADTLTETFVAANGDTLIVLCNQVIEETGVPGVKHGTDTWTVIGGTGRFSAATGSGTGETWADFNTNTFTKQMNGVITK